MDTNEVMFQLARARDRRAAIRVVLFGGLLFAMAFGFAAFDGYVRQWQYERFVIETWEDTTIVQMFEPFEV